MIVLSSMIGSRAKRATLLIPDSTNYAPTGSPYLVFGAPWGVPADGGNALNDATSTDTITVPLIAGGFHQITVTTQSGKNFTAGRRAVLLAQSDQNQNMEGDIISYVGTSLVVNIDPGHTPGTASGNSYTGWNIYQKALRGVDYIDTIEVDPGNFPSWYRINCQMPNASSPSGVYGYFMNSRGNYNNGTPAVATSPVKVARLANAGYTVSWTKDFGTAASTDILAEWYLSTTANDLNTKIVEIGWFLHTPPASQGFLLGSRRIPDSSTRYIDPSGQRWIVAANESGDSYAAVYNLIPGNPSLGISNTRTTYGNGAANFIMAMAVDVSDNPMDVTHGPLDIRDYVYWLYLQGEFISDALWLNGTAMGIEPQIGNSIVTFNNFSTSWADVGTGTPGNLLGFKVTKTSTSATMSFVTLSDTVTGYQYSQNGGAWTTMPGGNTVTGLTPSTIYTFAARAINGGTTGAATATVSVTTGPSGPANYFGATDPNDAWWVKTNMTSTTNQIVETTATGSHGIGHSTLARSAATKNMRLTFDIERVGSSAFFIFQIWDGSFGDLVNVIVDLAAMTLDNADATTTTWTSVTRSISATSGHAGRYTVVMDFTTDATSTNFNIQGALAFPAWFNSSYAGNASNGVNLFGLNLYNKDAGPGGF